MKIKNEHHLNTIKIICLVCTTIIIMRLFYLQIYLGDGFASQSEKNYIRYESIISARGEILDSNGNKLVTNKPIINLYWHGTGNCKLSEKQHQLLKELAIYCPAFTYNAEDIQRIEQAEKRNMQDILLENISFELLSKIEEYFTDHINLLIKHDFKRYYPHAHLASHIIGYLSNVTLGTTGKMGLEKQFQEKLQGIDGMLMKTINSHGKNITTQELHQSIAGKNIHTTLDLTLQQLVEKHFNDEHTGTCILLDPHDGAIKALCSRPNFDPSIFLDSLHPHMWQQIQQNNPFLNRAVQSAYPPGSLFKLITITAALETDMIKQNEHFICKGAVTFGKRSYLCNKKQGHGKITIKQALALSCNTLFYALGKRISIDTLADFAHRFGLGKKTGFMLYERNGLIPTTTWKQQQFGERWWPGETLSATIGQSYLLVTPMQIARMIGSIFTGYLTVPRILHDEPIKKQPLEVTPEVLNFLKSSMHSVVTEGTGHRISRIKDFTIHAKTSTAQTSDLKKRSLGKQFLEHGWVVAHFQYRNNKPLVFVLLVEHAGSSRIPMIITKNFLLDYRNLFS